MAELFTRQDQAYFGRTLGVNNLQAHFNNMEKALRTRVGHELTDVGEQLKAFFTEVFPECARMTPVDPNIQSRQVLRRAAPS